jgi:3-hydroxyethyl bacteriochlorophyllide a dehydrogenase
MAAPGARLPELIVGHGVLGRLLARLACAEGGTPTVWETDPGRRGGAVGYRTIHPDADEGRDYASIYDCSGDAALLDRLIGTLAPGGEIVLAGFYAAPIRFDFAPAFMREARLRVAAEWRAPDLAAVATAVAEGRLSLDGLITHVEHADRAPDAYQAAFTEPACLKMILDWRYRR